MNRFAFLGDEVTAAGFRLAGLEVHVPSDAEASTLFEQVLQRADLILMTAEVAQWVPKPRLRTALLRSEPPILVIPDIRHQKEPVDIGAVLRRQLGMAE